MALFYGLMTRSVLPLCLTALPTLLCRSFHYLLSTLLSNLLSYDLWEDTFLKASFFHASSLFLITIIILIF
ncbi:hypothetical protein DFJ74DRAFT_249029 [Hyaloraphidium curvatum]|nr:hypothetical protein DFJ74DRAFT_249029 [Hyaloraphidium curvatum]